jgi:hypothetical protein
MLIVVQVQAMFPRLIIARSGTPTKSFIIRSGSVLKLIKLIEVKCLTKNFNLIKDGTNH